MIRPARRAADSGRHCGPHQRDTHQRVLTAVTPGTRGRGCSLGDIALVAAPFVWLGMVMAISFVETPLKFQAPGITLSLGLGIGRLVFPVLNLLELLSALAVTGLLLRRRRRGATSRRVWALLAGLWAVLLTQAFGLRPVLDDRVAVLIAGGEVPDAPWHLLYIALELLKALGLVTLGAATLDIAVTVRTAHHLHVAREGRDA